MLHHDPSFTHEFNNDFLSSVYWPSARWALGVHPQWDVHNPCAQGPWAIVCGPSLSANLTLADMERGYSPFSAWANLCSSFLLTKEIIPFSDCAPLCAPVGTWGLTFINVSVNCHKNCSKLKLTTWQLGWLGQIFSTFSNSPNRRPGFCFTNVFFLQLTKAQVAYSMSWYVWFLPRGLIIYGTKAPVESELDFVPLFIQKTHA